MKTLSLIAIVVLGAFAPAAAQTTASSDAGFAASLGRIEALADLHVDLRHVSHETYPKYSDFDFSRFISKQELVAALQAMTNAAYGVGFRTLGHPDDFFHGHFIFDGKSAAPRLILWHTQERAFLYNWYDPKSRFNYVDKAKRNWITWLPGLKTEDARRYRYDHPGPQWCAEQRAFTIDPGMLDPAKLGFVPKTIPKYYQFNFYRTECDGLEAVPDSSHFSITLPGGRTQCMEFSYDLKKAYSKNYFKFMRKLRANPARVRYLGCGS